MRPADGAVAAACGSQHPEQRSAPRCRARAQSSVQAYACVGAEAQDHAAAAPLPRREALRFPGAAVRMYGDGEGTVWDRVARPHRDCMCYLGPPTTLMPMM